MKHIWPTYGIYFPWLAGQRSLAAFVGQYTISWQDSCKPTTTSNCVQPSLLQQIYFNSLAELACVTGGRPNQARLIFKANPLAGLGHMVNPTLHKAKPTLHKANPTLDKAIATLHNANPKRNSAGHTAGGSFNPLTELGLQRAYCLIWLCDSSESCLIQALDKGGLIRQRATPPNPLSVGGDLDTAVGAPNPWQRFSHTCSCCKLRTTSKACACYKA